MTRRSSATPPRYRPTPAEIAAAYGRTVPDLLAPGVQVLFCGINPSVYSAAVGHHFARPGNRFWRAVYEAGFTDRLLRPEEEQELVRCGCGATNLADRATTAAAEVSAAELAEGAQRLVEKVSLYQPAWLAVLGISAYRTAFGKPQSRIGPQPETIGGASVWVLPNPSGLNAHYRPAELAALFRELREAANLPDRRHPIEQEEKQ